MRRILFSNAAWLTFVLCLLQLSQTHGASSTVISDCSVLIAGGSTAALASGIAAATTLQSSNSSLRVCLTDPTNWLGGQVTSSAVPAIDFAWHTLRDPVTNKTLNVAAIDRDPRNVTPLFHALLQCTADPGACWVSTNCFRPTAFLECVQPVLDKLSSNLRLYRETVIRNVSVSPSGNRIQSATFMQRSRKSCSSGGALNSSCGYEAFLSEDLEDWYSPTESTQFDKAVVVFDNVQVFVDATEWGELLALSDAPYLQGLSEQYDGDVSAIGNDVCGQAIAYDFAQTIDASSASHPDPPNPLPSPYTGRYSLHGYPWQKVFSYRRIDEASETTVQNWNGGNDQSLSYIFLSRADAAAQVKAGTWTGGVSFDAIKTAEILSYGYHYWFKNQSADPSLFLDKSVLGTGHGLSKVPYMRESRRSIGIGGFVMNVTAISGTVAQQQGTVFEDTIAIGCYDVDIHPIDGCAYPGYVKQYYPILPFSLPFRAHTNVKVENMLVAGKTIAQSFLVNAATRLHPVEFASGTAVGVAAAYWALHDVQSSTDMLDNHIKSVQDLVEEQTPIRWTIDLENDVS